MPSQPIAAMVPISIHALREEGDGFGAQTPSGGYDFYPRPPRGGRLWNNRLDVISCEFLSTPSARRATKLTRAEQVARFISIHALREEGDQLWHKLKPLLFYFYPRPPRGGRQGVYICEACGTDISIHALREEGDRYCRPTRRKSIYFYPRPPRGGRRSGQLVLDCINLFLSTPSARRATVILRLWQYRLQNFYPRPPRGGRLIVTGCCRFSSRFLSTPSARRATCKTQSKAVQPWISIHALREEGDLRSAC